MTLRLLVCAAALALAAAAPAYADDKADAKASCVTLGRDALQIEQMPPEQLPTIENTIDLMCTCITNKIEALGDDGAKVLRVYARTTPEMAKTAAGSPDGDRSNAIAVMVAEYGVSEAEAGMIYDRVDPKVKVVQEECQAEVQAELMKSMPAQ